MKILVVDDELVIRSLIQRILQADGHDVSVAADGAEALRIFAAAEWNAVITDRAMPLMDGFALAAAVKKVAPQVPVILVSGSLNVQAEAARIAACVDVVLLKPFTTAMLRDALRKIDEELPSDERTE